MLKKSTSFFLVNILFTICIMPLDEWLQQYDRRSECNIWRPINDSIDSIQSKQHLVTMHMVAAHGNKHTNYNNISTAYKKSFFHSNFTLQYYCIILYF